MQWHPTSSGHLEIALCNCFLFLFCLSLSKSVWCYSDFVIGSFYQINGPLAPKSSTLNWGPEFIAIYLYFIDYFSLQVLSECGSVGPLSSVNHMIGRLLNKIVKLCIKNKYQIQDTNQDGGCLFLDLFLDIEAAPVQTATGTLVFDLIRVGIWVYVRVERCNTATTDSWLDEDEKPDGDWRKKKEERRWQERISSDDKECNCYIR